MTDLAQEKEICHFSAVTNRERPSSAHRVLSYCIGLASIQLWYCDREYSEKMIIGFTECRMVQHLVLSFQVLL